MTARSSGQFRLLFWKNLKILLRGKKWLVFEIGAPLACFAFFLVVAPKPKTPDVPPDLFVGQRLVETMESILAPYNETYQSDGSPCNLSIGTVLGARISKPDEVLQTLNNYRPGYFTFRKYDNWEKAVDVWFHPKDKDAGICNLYMVVSFDDFNLATGQLDYTIYEREYGGPAQFNLEKNYADNPYEGALMPEYEKYISYQTLFINIFLDALHGSAESLLGGTKSDGVNANGSRYLFDPLVMPMPATDLNIPTLKEYGYKISHLLLLPALMRSVSLIATEQEMGHRDLLNVMGMSNSLFLTSHILILMFKLLLTLVPMLVCFIIYVHQHVGALLIFLLGIVYCVNVLLLAGILAVLSPSGKTSFNVTFIVYLLLYYTHAKSVSVGKIGQFFTALNLNSAFPSAIDIALDFYHRKKHLGFGNMFDNKNTTRSFGIQFVMLFVDMFWMYGLMRGLDRLRQDFNIDNLFFWRSKHVEADYELKLDGLSDNHEKDSTREQAPADIKMENVVKIYKNGHLAVRKLDLTARRNQVTALLGHNGAGKSTAFNMISGSIFPTSGSVYVNDEEPIGYCPQHNVIYDDLTVAEHLWLFAKLKGSQDAEEQVDKMVADLNLEEKRKVQASRLSGGQKRKLCLGMTLIGNPRVVLLDEPTAGMDVEARDSVTALLEKYKADRTILITTHYLDEAEEMGDWVYIMFDGVVLTSGSVDYLIQRYGSGTVLKFLAGEGKNINDLSEQLSIMAKDTLGIETKGKVFEGQLEISVPNDSDFSGWHERFVKFLRSIESSKEKLGYQTFGIERNSLESVFFRVGELADEMTGKKKHEIQYDAIVDERHSKMSRPFFGLLALLAKRFLYSANNIFPFLFYIPVPIVVVFLLIQYFGKPPVAGTRLLSASNLGDMKFIRTDGAGALISDVHLDNYLKDIDRYKNLVRKSSVKEYSEHVKKYVDRPPLGVGIVFNNNTAYGVYNGNAFHTKPTVVNLLANLHLRKYLSDSGKASEKSGAITEHIKTVVTGEQKKGSKLSAMSTFVIALPFLLIFPTLVCISFIVDERRCKFDHLQSLTPISKALFWFAHYVYDFFWYMFVVAGLIFLLWEIFRGHVAIVLVSCALLFVFTATFIYTITVLIKANSNAEAMVLIILLISYFVALICDMTLKGSSPIRVALVGNLTQFISPMYSVNTIMSVLVEKASASDAKGSDFSMSPNGWPLMLMAVDIVICFAIFVFIRWSFWRKMKINSARNATDADDEEKSTQTTTNEDVKAEQQRLLASTFTEETKTRATEQTDSDFSCKTSENTEAGDFVLKVVNVSKTFPNIKAVRGVTFGIKRGECFGLLGASGAGKTTCFDIITELCAPTTGYVYMEKDSETGVKIGYCPQFDAIFGYLTGKQALVILACLHGYAHPYRKADHVLELVDMYSMRNKKMKNCSGGQKRRISMAAALLARAPLTILDEPTAGVDVKCRRDLWEHLNKIRASENATMMLTSHSMEECEALCTRIAILNHGEMVAIGSAQYLKSKYGGSFKMLIVLKKLEKRQAAIEEVKKEFATAELLTTSETSLHLNWRVDKADADDWSSVWHRGSQIALTLEAKSFSVTQASLEEAFIQVITKTNE